MHSRSIGSASIILIVACVLVWFTSSNTHSPVDSNAFLPQGAEDLGWPTIRGPHLTGHSDEIHLADAWPNHGPPVLWRRNLGQGYSSFVAFDGRVFTQYQTLAGQFVLCLDATTGSTLWQHRYDDPYELGGMYPGPRSTPTIDEKHIYFTSPDLTVGCLNWEGEELWSVDLSQRFESRGTGFGYACSPIIASERILLPVGGRNSAMIALNKRTGELIWKSGDDPASYSSALPVTVLEKQLVIGLLQNSLCGFDLHAGSQLFRVALSRGYDEHSAWPITRDDLVWISSPFQGGSQLYRIRPDQSPAIELIGEYESMSNDVASSVLVGEYVYGFDLKESQSNARHPSRGSFRCVNFYTGEIAWSNGNTKPRRSVEFETMKQSQTIGHASVIVADEKLILLNDTGDLVLAKASPEQYIELARARVLAGKTAWATPALHRGLLFVRNHSTAVCVYLGRRDRDNATALQRSFRLRSKPEMGSARNWIGIRSEDTLRMPTAGSMFYGWIATTASTACAAILTAVACLIGPRTLRSQRYAVFLSLSLITCMTAGPLLSHALNEFIFTWPGCLFLVFQHAMIVAQLRRNAPHGSPWHGRATAAGFIAMCYVYFVICRDHNLVSAWIFLCAFPAAIPGALATRWIHNRQGMGNFATETTAFLVSLTVYSVGAAAILWWRYGLPLN
ncbi:outer membrane biogenesis protein BamB [Stieleria neptunia]|uniref:Outer membrane biogenesis protein BamB n=1 Tax=Stieleria neptunia TaxID=2527979 RepID=A0A518HK59_9BACT|nr:PQQ-binding-like beta-propeller repeat protein [Stieleria neptunia]QDV41221.1 outer membrane biogenesis protein BamB [Stieleria neptunia]